MKGVLIGLAAVMASVPGHVDAECCRHTSVGGLLVQAQLPHQQVAELLKQMKIDGVEIGGVQIAPASPTSATIIVSVTFKKMFPGATGDLALGVDFVNPEGPLATDPLPYVKITEATVVRCNGCGPGVLNSPVRDLMNFLLGSMKSVAESELNTQLRATVAPLLDQIKSVNVRLHFELCASELVVIAYTGLLSVCGTPIEAAVTYQSNGTRISSIRIVQKYKDGDTTQGTVHFHFVNDDPGDWADFVIERHNGPFLTKTDHFDHGASRDLTLPMSGLAGVSLKIVLWTPGALGVPGMAGDVIFNAPTYGDVFVDIHTHR